MTASPRSHASRSERGAPSIQRAAGGGRWLYPLLLGLQTVGAVILFERGLPLYRQFVSSPVPYTQRLEAPHWTYVGIALVQIGYWLRYRMQPTMPRRRIALLGHLVLFVARLSFVVATSVFSFVFMTRRLASETPALVYVLTALGLFSVFCYMLELQRLGDALIDAAPRSDTRTRTGAG